LLHELKQKFSYKSIYLFKWNQYRGSVQQQPRPTSPTPASSNDLIENLRNLIMTLPRILEHTLNTSNSLAPLTLRLGAGVIFLAHGAQKLFGAFGGYGLEGTGQWMASIGLEPGWWMALLAGSAEFFGGLALIIGLLTRPAAVVLAFTMLVAIFAVHFSNGLFLSNNGCEFGLALLVISVSLAFSGGGRWSVDGLIAKTDRDRA
jgi:putative oxidoreductase